jgi:hypothetical protein
MTTLNPATRLSSPELAVTRAGPGEHLAEARGRHVAGAGRAGSC